MKILALIITTLLYSDLSFGQSETYIFSEEPLYIIGENHVIYQDPNGRKIIYPDLESFKKPDSRKHGVYSIAYDKNGIYFEGNLLNVDTTGIEIVGRNNTQPTFWLWKTTTKVFVNTKEIIGADAPSFSVTECLNGGYFKDKNFVYFFDKKIDKSDGKTVNETCDFELCYDKKYVYLKGEIMTFEGEVVQPINEVIFKTKTAVFNRNSELISGADPKSLKGLTRKYSIDKNHLYYNEDTCNIAPENLKIVKVWDQINSAYYADGENIYAANGYLIEGLDAATFGMLPESDAYFDKNGLYLRKWNSETNSIYHDKYPFNYHTLVTNENIMSSDYYIIYCDQAYNPRRQILYSNLSTEELKHIKNGGILPQDYVEPAVKADTIKKITFFPNTYFTIRNAHLQFGEKALIGSTDVELLAIFQGYRPGCGSDPIPYSNLYFFKNNEGYWILETKEEAEPIFLGTVFDPTWNPIFKDFKFS